MEQDQQMTSKELEQLGILFRFFNMFRFYKPRPLKEANKKVNALKYKDKENSIHGKELLQSQEQNIFKVQWMEVTISDLQKALEMKEDEYKKLSENHTIEL